ncbi:hypothetical protein CEY15_10280 [Dietzia natronolimnaea]|uniref:Uncharacterized protein n=1 Tax=Dietzia natronolimnaea TaxID=161920 RepID=A0A2A2WPQ0_9ACTN|nr:hypothetical protein [Dietzia natronolimnaea]PAY23167.1 hypothetical protein CEY15_10280 [Dietzia natronolimnaea]
MDSNTREPGTAIVADLTEVSLFTDCRGVMAEWNGQSQSAFESNLIRLRVEGRLGLGVGKLQAVSESQTAD